MDRRRGVLSASKLLKDIAPIEDPEGDIALGKDNDYVVEQDSYFGGDDSDGSESKMRKSTRKIFGSKYNKRKKDGVGGSEAGAGGSGGVVKKRKYTRRIKYSSESDDSDLLDEPEWDKKPKMDNKEKNLLSKQLKQLTKIAGMSEHLPSGSETEKKNEDGSTVVVPGKKEKGRRDIRGILHKKELAEETKNAEKEEHERKKRMVAFQALYNGLFKEPGSDEIIDRFVLDFDVDTKEPTVEVNRKIVSKLKPHQTKGIMFMWKSCFETLEQFKKNPDGGGSGGILGHCMGLGKTLQTIAFLHTIMTHPDIKDHVKRVLVICPLNTVGNWAKEFDLWLDDELKEDLRVHNIWEGVGAQGKFQYIKNWMKYGGVAIINYDAFRGLISGSQTNNHNLKSFFRRALVNPGPSLVICDEGHLLKNEKSQSSKALNEIRTLRRVVLTGTPLQNNLLEYYTMMSFVKPNLLGTLKEFCNRFVNPIINGQHKDSTQRDVRIMKRRAHVLHKLLDSSVQRLDHTVLVPYLPPKQEFVIFIKLTDIQNQLYRYYLSEVAKIKTTVDVAERMRKRGNFFCDYNTLQKIWTHPYLLTYLKEKKVKSVDDDIDEEEILNTFIFDDGENSNTSSSILSVSASVSGTKSKIRGHRKGSASSMKSESNMQLGGLFKWWESFFPNGLDSLDKLELSGKLLMLVEIIKKCIEIGDKLLVFSQYISTLDVIEMFLNEVELSDGRGWEKNKDYFRIDGSVSTENRQKSLDSFNLEADASKAKLFLISTRAGGLGVNLCGANRVVIFDVSWNPSTDLQSIFRVYRFGQKKPVYIYRLISDMSMEEKVYNRQVIKLSLAKRVVDEQQIERHFRFNDVYLMYGFNPGIYRNEVSPIFPTNNDKLLADVLELKKKLVYNVLEHESLLVNKVDEVLSAEERKAAWEDYIIERDMPEEDDSNNNNNNGGNNNKKNNKNGFANKNGFGKKGKLFNFARGWIEASFYGKNVKVSDDAMKDIIESLKIDIESLVDLNKMLSPSTLAGVSQILLDTKIDILRRMCHILFLSFEKECRDVPILEDLMMKNGYDISKAPIDNKSK